MGVPYSFALGATGGVQPYVWSILSDSPDTGAWLSISANGVLSGTPTTTETESVIIKVMDANGRSNSKLFSLGVTPALSISTTSPLPAATVGSAYSVSMIAAGGVAPYTWTMLSNAPDTGGWLSLSSGGALSGTPTTNETETLVIQARDSNGTTVNKTFSLVVGVALSITTTSPLPNGTVGTAYSATMAATGGTPPYTWAITADTPDTGSWLSISSGGVLTGTPGTAEIESLTIKVTDSMTKTVSAPFNLTVGSNRVLGTTYPLLALMAQGGDQSYGQNTTTGFVSYTASAPTTPAGIAVQALGAYDIAVIGASFEGGVALSGTKKQNLVTAIKAGGTFPIAKNASRMTLVFPYAIMESGLASGAAGGYAGFNNICLSNNWWAWNAAGGTGTKLTRSGTINASTNYEINYGYAWDAAAGSAGLDQPICGHVYGTLSNGQGPAQTAATYFASGLLTTNPQDSRFLSLTNGAAPNADGVFLDNCFLYPNGGGNLTSSTGFWDGISSFANGAVGAYPSGVSSLLARGVYHFFQTFQSYLAACNPGSTYYNFANFGNYWNSAGLGNIATLTANGIPSTFHGGLVEGAFGIPSSSYQAFQTVANMQANYTNIMAQCLAPKMAIIGSWLPATDGSSTATFTTGGVATVAATGTALEYQLLRLGLSFTLVNGNGYYSAGVSGYNWAVTRWYDEFGDDSLTQVNVKRGWLGTPVSTFVTLSNGVLARQFTGGCVLFNGWGNGVQTVTAAMLTTAFAQSYQFITGTQQPTINSGAAFASYALKDADGLFLMNAASSFAPNQPAGLTTLIDRQWNPTDPTIPGGVLPPSPLTGGDSFSMSWQTGDGGNTPPLINTVASLTTATGVALVAPPDGHATVMAIKYPTGQAGGTSPFAITYNKSLSTKQIYHCCRIFIPTGFNDNGNNIKWNGIESGGSANHIFMLVAGESDNRLCWLTLQGGFGNRELGGPGNDPNFVQCLPPPPPQGTTTGWLSHAEGKWSLFEYWAKQETTPGVSADGQFKAWVDGVLITFYNNINFNATSGNPNAFNITNIIPYYGGGGGAAPSNQYIFVGRWYVAVQ